jgi:peptide subunit release factor 1 (eRF1)
VSAVARATKLLAEHRTGHRVVSLYLDLDPERFATPPARASQIRSLIDEAHKHLENTEGLDHEERISLRSDLERIDTYLSSDDPPFQGARALAVFCCGRDGLFEVLQLPRTTDGRVWVELTPYIEPLVVTTAGRRWAVVLVNRRVARLLTGTESGLTERERFTDDVRGLHDQGGPSQANYQRSIEKDTDDHLRRAAEDVYRYWQREPFDRLAVGGPEEIASRLEKLLHPDISGCLVDGRVDVDVATANEEQVESDLQGLAEEDDKRVEREALDRLAAGIGTGGRAVGGPADTVEALNERRVGSLLLEQGFDQPAARCPSCGLLVLEIGGRCPIDGTELEHIDHLREAAVEAAVVQDADVMIVSRYPDLGPFGGIGALLRF